MNLLAPLVIDLGVSQIPHLVFIIIHLAILAVAATLAYRTAATDGSPKTMWAFILIAVGEVSYIGYHVAFTTFLLSHTLSEVLVLVAIVLFFMGRRERD